MTTSTYSVNDVDNSILEQLQRFGVVDDTHDHDVSPQPQQQYICIDGEPLQLEDEEEKEEYKQMIKRSSANGRRRRRTSSTSNSFLLSKSNNSTSSFSSLFLGGGQGQLSSPMILEESINEYYNVDEQDDEDDDDDDDDNAAHNDNSSTNDKDLWLLDEQERQEYHDELERCRQMDDIMGIPTEPNESNTSITTSFIQDVDPESGSIYDGPMIHGIKHHLFYGETEENDNPNIDNEYYEPASLMEPKQQLKFLGIMKYNKPHKGTWITPSYTYTGTVDVRGKFHSPKGVYYADLHSLTYEGDYVHGYKHGIGKETYEDTNFTIVHYQGVGDGSSSCCPCHSSNSVNNNSNVKNKSNQDDNDNNNNSKKNRTISFGSVVIEYKGSFKRDLKHGLGTMIVRQTTCDKNEGRGPKRQQSSKRKHKTKKQPHYRNDEEQSLQSSSFVEWFRTTNNNNNNKTAINGADIPKHDNNNNVEMADDDDDIVFMYSGYWYEGKQHGEHGCCEMIWYPKNDNDTCKSTSSRSVVEVYRGPFRRGKRHGRGILKISFEDDNEEDGDEDEERYENERSVHPYPSFQNDDDRTQKQQEDVVTVVEREGLWRSGIPVVSSIESSSRRGSTNDWVLRYNDGSIYQGQICSQCLCCPNGYGQMSYGYGFQHQKIELSRFVEVKRFQIKQHRQTLLEEKKQREQTAKEARALLLKTTPSSRSSAGVLSSDDDDYDYFANDNNDDTTDATNTNIEELLVGTNFTLLYKGEWHYGKRQGKGTCIYPTHLEELSLLSSTSGDNDRKVYEGIWMNDEPISLGEKDDDDDDNTEDEHQQRQEEERDHQQQTSLLLHHPYDMNHHHNSSSQPNHTKSTASTAVTSITTTTSTGDMIDWDDLDLDQENFDRFLEEFQDEKPLLEHYSLPMMNKNEHGVNNSSDDDDGWNGSNTMSGSGQQQVLLSTSGSRDSDDDGGSYYLYSNGDIYRGTIDEYGQRQGRGIYVFNNTHNKLRYEGEFVNNVRHGMGIMFTCRTKYIGEYHNNKRSGLNGTFLQKDHFTSRNREDDGVNNNNEDEDDCGKSLMYRGPFVNGKFHGSDGILVIKDGQRGLDETYEFYKGEWKYGKKCGAGEEELSSDEEKYVGEFHHNQRHGVGTLLDLHGNIVYSGSWKDGYMDGEGILYTIPPPGQLPRTKQVNGQQETCSRDEFHGTFVRGKKSGTGKLFCQQKQLVLKGTWLRDIPMDGEWKVINSQDGTMFSGFATCTSSSSPSSTGKNNTLSSPVVGASASNVTVIVTPVPNGFGTLRYQNGDLYTGLFRKGQREGRGICVFSNGDRWDGTWKHDAVDVDGTGVLTLADGTEHVFGPGIHGGSGGLSTSNTSSPKAGLTADDFPL